MSHLPVKNQSVEAPRPAAQEVPSKPAPQSTPSPSAQALARTSSAASYQVSVPSDAFNVASVGNSEVRLIASGDIRDGELQEDQVVSYARHASYRMFTSGGLTRQRSGELGTASTNPEGHSLGDSRFEAQNEAEEVLQFGLNRLRGGYV